MNFSPRMQANLASAALTVPYLACWILYRESLSQRAWVYLSLGYFLASVLTYQWVFHRQSGLIPAAALPRPELRLDPDRMPAMVWLALVPPIALALLLWLVTLHGATLPWRDTWLGPPQPAAGHRMYLPTVTMLIAFNGLASWKVIYSLARWHGMARTYPFRRERLRHAVLMQWVILISSSCWAGGFNFYLPAVPATACAIAYGAGLSAVVWWGRWEYQLRGGDPQTGSWCYWDFRDPTFFGPRGLNLANGWSWILAAGAIAPVVLAEWLYQRSLG